MFVFLCRSISLSITASRSIHVVTKSSIALFMAEYYSLSCVCIRVCVRVYICGVRTQPSVLAFTFPLAQTVCFLARLPPSSSLSPPHPWRPGPPAHLLLETSLALSAVRRGAHACVFGSGQPCPLSGLLSQPFSRHGLQTPCITVLEKAPKF